MEALADKVHKQGEYIPQHSYISHNHSYINSSDTLGGTISISTATYKPNGVIMNYEIHFTISTGVMNYINTSATQHTLRYLLPNTMITFSVRAYAII